MSLFIVRWTNSSLPGIGWADMITVSPRSTSNTRCRPQASRPRTADGSPCVPVAMMTSSLGFILFACSMLTNRSGQIEVAEPRGDLNIFLHAKARDRHLAPVALGGGRDLLDARDQRGKGGDDNPPGGLAEDFLKRRVNHALRGRPAGVVRVRAIREQREHPALRKLRQLGEIGRPTIDRRVVELEIARMDDQPDRSRDAQP